MLNKVGSFNSYVVLTSKGTQITC